MNMTKRQALSICTAVISAIAAGSFLQASAAESATRPPNVIVLLTDDLGYGDVGCYGAKPEHIRTPCIDEFAREGLRFTDGHAASSVCTPSRYSLLSGEYAFRNKEESQILPGDARMGFMPDRETLPQMFKSAGYATGIVGKWHLGLSAQGKPIDWNGSVEPGPEEIGFDETFYIPATGDRVPTVFVRNHHVVNLDPSDPITVSYKARIGNEPTAVSDPDLALVLHNLKGHGHNQAITNGISRIGYMTGGKSALWHDEKIADTLTSEAIGFVERHKDKPFFLYFATHNIHEPRVPGSRFAGKSGAGVYGDFVEELDDSVGQLVAALKRLNLDENTLVIFCSDNGATEWVGYDYGARSSLNGHQVNGVLRGEKGTIFEGGTRNPFIVRWPGHVAAGGTSDALVSQTDFMASFAHLLGVKVPEGAAPDSVDVLDALLGKSPTGRHELVEHQYNTGVARCALRVDQWKWIGGHLYDLSKDLPEKNDLAQAQPDRAKAMASRLEEIVNSKKAE